MALLKLAVRNLRRNRRRSVITLAAMVVGIGVMTFLRGFINGQQDVMLENIVKGRIGGVQVHRKGYVKNVLTSPLQLDMTDSPELRQKMASVPHVTAVAPRIEFGAMVSTPDKAPAPEDGSPLPEDLQGKTSFFMATAVEPEVEARVTPRRSGLINAGRMFPTGDTAELVLNADFAVGLDAPVHDAKAALPPIEQQLALLAGDRDGALNGENVVLGGTVPSFSPGDKRVGLVPLAVAQRVLRMEGRVTEYALSVDTLSNVDAARDELRARLGPDYEVHSWSELFPFMKVMIGTQDFIFSIVSAVFLTVVLLGIVNAMLMTVLERTREIGTMLAVGMKRLQIIQLFMLEGVVIGVVGGAIGLCVGLLLVTFFHSKGIPLPAPGATVDSVVRPWVSSLYISSALVGTPLGAALATLWPAWRAALLRPVEALSAA